MEDVFGRVLANRVPKSTPEALRVLDLFSGIGGFSLGLERTGGFETVAFCEIEEFPRRVLAKHWPGVPIYDDVRTLTAERLRADGIVVDVICGGFPCQDISSAGPRDGLDGERSGLWFEYARLVRQLRPRYVIVENVADLLSRGLGDVVGSLAEIGYDAEWHCIPAAAVGAEILRDRVYIVAFPDESDGHPGLDLYGQLEGAFQPARDRNGAEFRVTPTSEAIRADDGLSSRLDSPRREALGNAVVPQIPELIGRAILQQRAALDGQASMPAAISSTAAPNPSLLSIKRNTP